MTPRALEFMYVCARVCKHVCVCLHPQYISPSFCKFFSFTTQAYKFVNPTCKMVIRSSLLAYVGGRCVQTIRDRTCMAMSAKKPPSTLKGSTNVKKLPKTCTSRMWWSLFLGTEQAAINQCSICIAFVHTHIYITVQLSYCVTFSVLSCKNQHSKVYPTIHNPLPQNPLTERDSQQLSLKFMVCYVEGKWVATMGIIFFP